MTHTTMRLRCLTLCIFCFGIAIRSGFSDGAFAREVVTYPAPQGVVAASDFSVRVDGQEVFTYDAPVAAISYFSFDGTIEVEVRPSIDVKWVDIRPKRLGIRPVLANNVIRFTLTEPCNISVELNGEWSRPLLLFANPLEVDHPNPGDPNVRYYKGGEIHEAGLVQLKSNEIVYIEGGAIVRGAFLTENAQNVTIRGRGILDGSTTRELSQQHNRHLHLVRFDDSKHIRMEGIILSDARTWQIVPVRSEDIELRNIKIVSGNGGDDGIDLVRSRNVRIEDVFVRTKDDCIAVKSFMDDPLNRGTEDVTVRNSVFWNAEWGNGLEIGFELRSPTIRRILFQDNDIIHVNKGAVLSIHNADSATVHDIHYEDIRIEQADHKLFDLAIFLSRFSIDGPETDEEAAQRYLHGAWDNAMKYDPADHQEVASHRGRIRDITFKNIHILEGPLPFSIFAGFDENHLVENITIDGLWVGGQKIDRIEEAKFYIEHTHNIRFSNAEAEYSLPGQ